MAEKLKVRFIRYSLLSRGGDKMVLAHANHLAESGHDVSIETSLVDTVFDINPKVKINVLGTYGKLGFVWRCFSTRYRETDLLIADIIPLADLLFFRNPGKVIYFAQDYDESYYSFQLQKLFIRFLYFLGLGLFKISTVAVSKKLGKLLTKRFAIKTVVVENGVDRGLFFPDPDDRLVSAKEGRKAVVVLSREDYRKGFDLVPEILQRVREGLDVLFEVWIVGDAVDVGISDVLCRNFGYVNEVRLRQILSSADLFLYPTRHEGFGLMILEAMACHCPFVTTDAVPVAEHGKGGFVSQVEDIESLADQIMKIFQTNSSQDELLHKGMNMVHSYNLKDSQKHFEQILYSKVIGDRKT